LIKLGKEDRKEFIAKAATIVFSDKGYKNASVQDVAQKAGMSKPGLYYYFKSKEEILAHILIKNADIFLQKLQETLKENKKAGLSQRESFRNLIHSYAAYVNSDKHRRLLVLRERDQLSRKYRNELLRREKAMFVLMRSQLSKIDDIDKTTNENVITFLLISMSHWLGYWVKDTKKLSLEDIINENIKVVFNGMLKR
jgi:TetR/AcrR family transcriptional regulator, cholesterol catabolism regulator